MVETPVRAARGNTLRCRGWRQEALLRMLENTVENGEQPEELIIYGGLAKAARDWDSFHRLVALLRRLRDDETLVVQSGKPIGVFRSPPTSPLVVMATSNLVGRWATSEHWYGLERRGLTIWGGYTAADWQYIGSQGIVQGTYQTFAAVAKEHFDGTLAGRLVVTAGLGGMGGAQPLAIVMNGGVALCVEVDPRRIQRRIETGYLERAAESLDAALALAREAVREGRPMSLGVLGNAAEVHAELRRRGVIPDVVTDQTSAHDLLVGYVPAGMDLVEVERLRREDAAAVMSAARASILEHVRTMLAWQADGAIVFEYGNNIRAQAAEGGMPEAFSIPGFTQRYLRPFFWRGIGPFRWVAVTGEPGDIALIDTMVLETFADDDILRNWVSLAQRHVRSQGLPARIAWLGHGDRSRLALLVNEAVANGRLSGPVAFTRDHLDAAGVAQPLRETEGMLDGSDAVADWPLLDALLNCTTGADLVALHGGGGGYAGFYQSAGVTIVADGTETTAERLEAVLTGDTGLGVLRYADAGYVEARDAARRAGLLLEE